MAPGHPSFQFGPFEIRPATGELWKDGRRIRLAPQPFQVLALIVEREGNLVARDAVRTAVWTDGTTVEFDQGLNYCLRQIRLALGDDARQPRYVETVPKRGYRLLVPVEPIRRDPVASAAAAPVPVAETSSLITSPSSPTRAPLQRRSLLRPAAAGITLAAGIVSAVLLWGGPFRAAPAPVSAEARQAFEEAEHLARSWEIDKVEEAVSRYESALRLEPRYAEAWAGLTHADIVLSMSDRGADRALADSEVHARRALEIDETLSAAHAALGHSYWHQWRWREADAELRQAVDADDSDAVAHQLYGLYLASVGRSEEAVQHARRAVALAPVSGLLNYSLAQVYLQTGDFESAIIQADRTLQIDRHFPLAYYTLVRANAQLGRLTDATDAIEAGLLHTPDDSMAVWRAYVDARLGRMDEARTFLAARRAARKVPGSSVAEASVLVALGDLDAAFALLDEAIDAHVGSLLWIRTAPELGPLRGDPRFGERLARLHLD